MPAAIRERLAEVERRMAAKKTPAVSIKYSVDAKSEAAKTAPPAVVEPSSEARGK